MVKAIRSYHDRERLGDHKQILGGGSPEYWEALASAAREALSQATLERAYFDSCYEASLAAGDVASDQMVALFADDPQNVESTLRPVRRINAGMLATDHGAIELPEPLVNFLCDRCRPGDVLSAADLARELGAPVSDRIHFELLLDLAQAGAVAIRRSFS